MDDRYRAAWGLSGSGQDADGLLRASPGCYPASRLCPATATAPLDARLRSRFKTIGNTQRGAPAHGEDCCWIEISKRKVAEQFGVGESQVTESFATKR